MNDLYTLGGGLKIDHDGQRVSGTSASEPLEVYAVHGATRQEETTFPGVLQQSIINASGEVRTVRVGLVPIDRYSTRTVEIYGERFEITVDPEEHFFILEHEAWPLVASGIDDNELFNSLQEKAFIVADVYRPDSGNVANSDLVPFIDFCSRVSAGYDPGQ